MGIIREKKHRLNKEAYQGEVVVSFNIKILGFSPLFVTPYIFRIFENHLLFEMKRQKCEIPVYLFMPDHVHLVTQGLNSSSECLKAVKLFKQKTGYWLSDNKKNCRWQKIFMTISSAMMRITRKLFTTFLIIL
jgi:hypothetical protein